MRRLLVLAIAVASLMVVIAAPVVTGDGSREFRATLIGYNEVPAVSTTARGTFRAEIEGQTVSWRLSYRNVVNVTQSHIHFGQPAVNGGISVFLCSNLGNGPAGTPACPATNGDLSGTFSAADVIGPGAQGITAGEFDELVRAMRAGVTYANVHSTTFPGGEIRGRIVRSDDD